MSEDAGAKQRLLIVDDSKVIRVTARKILRDHFETIEAVDGENAWETLNSEGPFSLIVSDLTMPNLDGFGLLERIRSSQHPDIRDIPVIIITGANDSEKTKSRATEAGATDFIGKPFDSVHLLARTQAHANAHLVSHALRNEAFVLEQQATTDLLTALPNEVGFMERGYQLLSYAIRHKSSLSVLLIEIDNYADLGRRHGKQAMETIIRSVASTLNGEIRQEDIMARTGAARFGLLLSGMGRSGIHNLSERICRGVSTSPVRQGQDRVHITVSAGVATPEIRRDTRLEDLLSEAAQHLSVARSRGGNQAIFADSLDDQAESAVPATAGKAALPAETIMEIVSGASMTEIEIGVPLEPDADGDPSEELPAVECRETSDTAPLPGKIAGPVCDSPRIDKPGTLPDEAHARTETASKLAIETPDVQQGKAVFGYNDVEGGFEETIVITAPFDVHFTETSDQVTETGGCDRSEGASSTRTSSLTATTAATASVETPENEETATGGQDRPEKPERSPRRRGSLRRLFAAVFSPLRRHRKA